MSASVRNELGTLLLKIEAELRLLDYWSFETPPDHALQSNLPFCCDTLEIEEWLQFIFIPRMKHILQTRADLPKDCAIVPYLEECIKCKSMNVGELLLLLRQVDRILT